MSAFVSVSLIACVEDCEREPCLPVRRPVSLSVRLAVSVGLHLYRSVHLLVYLPMRVSACRCIRASVSQVCLSASLSVANVSVCVSVCPPVRFCVFAYLSACLSVCLRVLPAWVYVCL